MTGIQEQDALGVKTSSIWDHLNVGLLHWEINMPRLPHTEGFMTGRVSKHDRGYTAD